MGLGGSAFRSAEGVGVLCLVLTVHAGCGVSWDGEIRGFGGLPVWGDLVFGALGFKGWGCVLEGCLLLHLEAYTLIPGWTSKLFVHKVGGLVTHVSLQGVGGHERESSVSDSAPPGVIHGALPSK